MSRHYASRIARIPPPPSPPPLPPRTIDDELLSTLHHGPHGSPPPGNYDIDYGMDTIDNGFYTPAADAAQVLEDSLLGASLDKGKGRQSISAQLLEQYQTVAAILRCPLHYGGTSPDTH